MGKIERSAIETYSAEQMYNLVNDIEAYPQFIAGCKKAKVLQRGEDWLEAQLDLAKVGIHFSFITRNHLKPYASITMQLVEGPFERLEGLWQFNELTPTACKVVFSLEFSLSNRFLDRASASWFEQLATEQVKAMSQRAQQVYGKPVTQ